MHRVTTGILSAILTGIALFGLLAACGDGPETPPAPGQAEDQTSSTKASLIARLALAGGTVVEFYEPIPGELVVATWASSKDKLAAVTALQQGSTAAALYEKLSGKQAPAELLAVDERVQTAQLERKVGARRTAAGGQDAGERFAPTEKPADGIGTKISALTATDFQNAFCQTSSFYDFKFCWTDRTGYSSAWRWSFQMHTIIWSNSGSTFMQMDTRNLFWWNSMQWFVPEGNWFHIYSVGGLTERKVGASGAHYHNSVFGY